MKTTFKASSGNVATISPGPGIGNRFVIDVCWVTPPTKGDMRECDEWFSDKFQEIQTVPSELAETPAQFDAIADNFLGRKDN